MNSTPAASVLRVSGLSRYFGSQPVVVGLNLDLWPGQAAALVGPNGCGKSTALRCIVGADQPSSGTVELDGQRLDERSAATRRAMAVVMDDLDFFADLSVVEHLDLLARAHRMDDPDVHVDQVLADVGLADRADVLPGALSSGQRRRLALASALVRPHQLLVLDEPEQRLDTEGLRWLGDRLLQAKRCGVAVLLASHSTDLVDRVADEVLDLGQP